MKQRSLKQRHLGNLVAVLALCILPFITTAVRAALDDAQAEALLAGSGCSVCHGVDQGILGPSYMEVAEKYKGEPGATELLFERIRQGSTGVWGQVPMMPVTTDTLGDEDLNDVLAWILSR